jgi:hypothetical protein
VAVELFIGVKIGHLTDGVNARIGTAGSYDANWNREEYR